MTVIINRKDAL